MRRQFAWNFAAQTVGLILPPLLLIVLARILEPSDFGVFALLMVVISLIQAVSLSPIGEVIIKSDREDIGDFIFTLQFTVGVIFSILLFANANNVARIFDNADLALPLRVSCLLLLISPLVDTAIRMSMRKISFKAVFVRRVVSPVGNALISIPLAIYGAGYWALIWGQISGIVISATVVVAMGGWKPSLNFQVKMFLADLRFTWQMILQSMVRWIRSQSDKALLGMYIPAAGMGQYDLARKFAGMPFAVIVQPVAQVLYAVLADQIRQQKDIRELFLISQRRVLMVTLPLCAIMVINANGIIAFVLGAKWLEISSIFIIFSIVGALSSFVGSNMEVFKAKGQPEIMTRFMLVRALFTLPIFLWLAPMGITELSYGVLGLAIVFGPLNLLLTIRLLKINIANYLADIVTIPAILAFVISVANLLILQLEFSSWKLLLINLSISGLIMLAAGFYWERDLFRRNR